MKKQLNYFLSVVILSLFSFHAYGQQLNHVLGDILVQPVKGADVDQILLDLKDYRNIPSKIENTGLVSKRLNIWRLHFDYNAIHEINFLEYVKRHPKVNVAQFNHLITMRETTPDDPLFSDQWQFINDGSNGGTVDGDIDADQAWDITTGGVTTLGDTIVVAVLDDGIDLNHDDFEDNLWINYAEIPNNNIDDDNNGYVDDYRGWNISSDSDNIAGGGHGTPVAGIIGAKGNNGIGVTGVNWNVKVMVIKNDFNTNEAQVLEAYSYALDARIRYNETNGAEGSFVVSTNASWGIDGGDPADAPLWCAFYDTLGVAGIVSCGATINGNQNVDTFGDLPTACPSDFLISVTNVDRTDNKVTQAGYGAMTIDLGAHGADAFTTSQGNNYGGFGGTSGATPHVAGALALLYAAPCENLATLAKTDPAAAALLAKQYILEGTDPNASLQGITTTGGRLNIFNSLQMLMNNCSPCPPAFSFNVENVLDVSASLIWTPGINSNTSALRWREVGASEWNTISEATSPYMLNNLTACTDYEFQVDAICDGETSGYSQSFVFKTDGCCEPPTNVNVSSVDLNTAIVSWDAILAAQSYNLLISSASSTQVISNIINTSFGLSGLEPCTDYMVSVQTVCENEITEFGTPVSFTTFGCGACLDLEYCAAIGESTDDEWIQSIEVADLINNSGNDSGYGNYSGLSANVMTYNSYNITLTQGYSGNAFDEYFRIWIDYNHDGDFADADELAFDPGSPSNQPVTGTITIPGDATLGLTRMRIAMRWEGVFGNSVPENCEDFGFGEVEDYCINISMGAPVECDMAMNLDTSDVSETTAILYWEDPTDDHLTHNLRIKEISESDWTVFEDVESPYTASSLTKCTDYEFQIEAVCLDGMNTSGYTESFEFETQCIITSSEDLLAESEYQIFPNPFSTSIRIDLKLSEAGETQIQIIDIQGRVLNERLLNGTIGTQTISIDNLDQMVKGIYFVRILSPDGLAQKKIVKL